MGATTPSSPPTGTPSTPPVSASGRVERALEAAAAGPLAAFLHTQRWFGGKGREIRGVRVRDHAVIEPSAAGRPCYAVVLLQIASEGVDGDGDLYSVPLVIGTGGAGDADSILGEVQVDGASVTIGDALADGRFGRALLAAIARAGTIRTARGGAVVGHRGPALSATLGGGAIEELAVRPLRAEQSNTSLVFSPGGHDRIVMKCLRRLVEGVGIEVEIGELLTRVGFRGAPASLGHLTYVAPGKAESITLAVAQQFVPNEGDGWGHALADLRSRLDLGARSSRPSREPYDSAVRALGRTTAQLHRALASESRDPAFAPEPFTVDDREQLATAAATRLVEVVEWTERARAQWPDALQPLARDLVARAPAFAERLRAARALPADLPKTRVHGDFHLGQVLRVHEPTGAGAWMIVDFEGEPMRPLVERRAKSSPLRDVAGMLRSFDYAAFAAVREARSSTPIAELERVALAWRDAAREAFLQGWLAEIGAATPPLAPRDPKALADALALFELDKALYELAYEIENRPDWVAIPLRGIHMLTK